MSEYRSIAPDGVRVVDTAKHQFEIDTCVYNVVDDYKTRWIPGVFTRSLESKKPPLCWAHDWKEPIGHPIDVTDGKDSLRILYQLDDFEAVPRARQAWAQQQSGTLRDASFGFSRDESVPADGMDGVFDIREARLDECSLVLSGAVPGAMVVGSRGVRAAQMIALGTALEEGDMTFAQATTLLERAANGGEIRAMHAHAHRDGTGSMKHSHAGDTAMHAHEASGSRPALLPMSPVPAARAAALDTDDPEDTVKCPVCGAMNEPDAHFCDQCGADLAKAKPREAPHDAALESEARDLLRDIQRR